MIKSALGLSLIFALGLLLVVNLNHVSAQETAEVEELNLPGVKLTPDLPLYFLKNLGEGIRLVLTRGIEKKIQLELNFAEERLAEAYRMGEKEKYHIADKLFKEYEKRLDEVLGELKNIRDDKIDVPKLVEKFQESIYKEQRLLKVMEDQSKRSNGETKQRVEIMKNRADFGAQNKLKELFSLKVRSQDFAPPFLSPVPLPFGAEGGER